MKLKIDETTITKSKKITETHDLCVSCLGRLFTLKYQGFKNKSIGEKIKNSSEKIVTVAYSNCKICQGLSDEIETLIDLVKKNLKDYEFKSFLVGCKVDEDILEFEEKIQKEVDTGFSESIKREINRRIGKNIEEKLGKTVDFDTPDIMIKIDTSFYVVDLQVKHLYIYGRYRKLRRDIPQTKWFCKICKGVGCKKCEYTGKLYDESVEGLISDKVLSETKGDDESFHGAGREDIDALMLGNGRPFVLEIKNPKIRIIDLKELEKKINRFGRNKIEVLKLRFADSDEKARIKEGSFRKVYRVTFNAEKPLNIEKLKKAIHCLQGCKIKQRTPNRVAHRRADMIRERQIYQCKLETIEENIAVLEIEAESGTYIKELISGDDCRTKPNISDMIENQCTVTYLDVLEVKGE